MKYPFIAVLTDFGEDDFFVASLKGVILSINPFAQIIDISHRIPSFDIASAGFVLFSCYKFFPAKTIFLVIVDPGVGSNRRILLAVTKKYFFIAPDNGVLSFVLESEEIQQTREVTNPKFFLTQSAKTFEGRDKMAPVAAWISQGISLGEFGSKIDTYEKLKIQKPERDRNTIIGHIIHIDKFGNLITNIPQEMISLITKNRGKKSLNLIVRKEEITSFEKTYSSGKKRDLVFLINSLGLVEIVAREDSAFKLIKASKGDEVRIIAKKKL